VITEPSISCRAYAKINLALSVGPPEPAGSLSAGMHPIASWMAAVDLFDDLSVTRLGEGELSVYEIGWVGGGGASTSSGKNAVSGAQLAPPVCSPPPSLAASPPAGRSPGGGGLRSPRESVIDWPLEKDLAVRAHRLLEVEAGRALPVHLRLEKRIPVGGGLGGGSSNGAAALMAVNELFGLGMPVERLARLSAKLGSDVAFFLDEDAGPPRPAVVTGMGDRIERTGALGLDLVLVFPPFGCPTGAVYKAYDRMGPRELREQDVRGLAASEWTGRGAELTGRLFNDLAAAAESVAGELAGIRSRVAALAGSPCHVTGSGSTLFVVCGDGKGAEELARAIGARVKGVGVHATKIVAAHGARSGTG
jgi:4-diphosphocytidyl-2-C-methyl-D-erythritol kinase